MSNGLDPSQARHYVPTDLCTNLLHIQQTTKFPAGRQRELEITSDTIDTCPWVKV